MNKAPLCTDCRYFAPESLLLWLFSRLLQEKWAHCGRAHDSTRNGLESAARLVTPRATDEDAGVFARLCLSERSSFMNTTCGPEGRFWEPREREV